MKTRLNFKKACKNSFKSRVFGSPSTKATILQANRDCTEVYFISWLAVSFAAAPVVIRERIRGVRSRSNEEQLK